MSNFALIQAEWPVLYAAARKAERCALPDPRTACVYARRALELTVRWLYEHDAALSLPYQDHLSALIYEPTFLQAAGPAVCAKAKLLKDLGNLAVHSTRRIYETDAVMAVRELWHVCFWLARTYARAAKPGAALAFDAALLQHAPPVAQQTLAQLQALVEENAQKDVRLSTLLADKAALDEELKLLRAQVAQVKAANAATPDSHDYSEAETRDAFIDLLLREAGWGLHEQRDREYEVHGMPNEVGKGYVDYVLWGADGKPLALVEAKRTKHDPRMGQQQAKLYADCLEQQFGQRPVIFYSNGYEHWLWDDVQYPPRPVQGFLKRDELELLVLRRSTRLPLRDAEIDLNIVERFYQTRAIRRIGESFEQDHARKALVVMATGAGKTRTVIALCNMLMRANWVKRVLFLADRTALVNQAVGAFKKHLPDSSPVNLVTEKDTDGRVYVCTYQSMMRRIDEMRHGVCKFGVGHFDLVVIDEAHRSVYRKYRAIFEYFDALLVGLTATPKDEIDRNTYGLFDLETGVPTDAYGLEEAVRDGFLVPPQAVSVPLKFVREGIKYADLSEAEREQWDAQEWDEEGEVPERVEAEAINKWLFNTDTVDQVLKHLMLRGQKVAQGDRLGKTIIFAKNQQHAEFITERFDVNYPHLKGSFARSIICDYPYAQSLIDDFSIPGKPPHIAISVDMLDTGIDVPEVVNLVYFKLVRSKTKFWQMLGRGTRLCKDLFAPGKSKEYFYIFDYCQNLEYFSQNPEASDGASGEALSTKLFVSRLRLIGELDSHSGAELPEQASAAERTLRDEVAGLLQQQVAAMNVDNFVVRAKRRLVDQYAATEAWRELNDEALAELARDVAGLPTELTDDDVDAKQFDLLMLRLELAQLRADQRYAKLRKQVRNIASLLEEVANIPLVREQLALLQDLQSDEWWQDVTVPMLDNVRKRLRALVKLIERRERHRVYTNFEDVLGEEELIGLPGLEAGVSYELFRQKAQQFLREHENHITVHKLRWNKPLTPSDLSELEQMLLQAGVGTAANVLRAKQESHGLGLFIRSLVGLDREAAKQAFGGFLGDKTLSANQIEFVNLIIDHLTQHGVMEPGLLYESPYTDISGLGPEGVFSPSEVEAVVTLLTEIRQRAAA